MRSIPLIKLLNFRKRKIPIAQLCTPSIIYASILSHMFKIWKGLGKSFSLYTNQINWSGTKSRIYPWYLLFSAYAKCSTKLMFLTPWYALNTLRFKRMTPFAKKYLIIQEIARYALRTSPGAYLRLSKIYCRDFSEINAVTIFLKKSFIIVA